MELPPEDNTSNKSNEFSVDPVVYWNFNEFVAVNSSEQFSELNPRDTIDTLDNAMDYVAKITATPLPATTMDSLLNRLADEYSDPSIEGQQFKKRVVEFMQFTFRDIKMSIKPGDCITFNCLSSLAEEAIGYIADTDEGAIVSGNYFSIGNLAKQDIDDRFAKLFDQQSQLEHIGDNVDNYTVHPGINTDSPWVKQRRGDTTVWVKDV